MRYRLRTLLIVLALARPLLGGAWQYAARWQAWRARDSWDDVGGPGAIDSFNGIMCSLVVEQTIEEATSPDGDASD
jgi:hypothetical protein